MKNSAVSALLLVLWGCLRFVYATRSSSFPAMFFLGASMLDVGTNDYVANSTMHPVSPPYATDRFSNGLIISDFLGTFAGLPPVPPYLKPGANLSHGANFASAGSGLLSSTGYGVVPFFNQLAQFAYLTRRLVKYDLRNSPVVINVGTNDLQAYTDDSPMASRPFAKMLSNKLRDGLKGLYYLGARKILVIGISPLGCIPSNRLRSTNRFTCFEPLNKLVTMYNEFVQASLEEMRTEFPDLQITFFDAFSFTEGMINNGAKYGFQVIEKRCCGAGELNAVVSCRVELVCKDPETYLYWDYHPTEKAYGIISEAIWSAFIGAYDTVQDVR